MPSPISSTQDFQSVSQSFTFKYEKTGKGFPHLRESCQQKLERPTQARKRELRGNKGNVGKNRKLQVLVKILIETKCCTYEIRTGWETHIYVHLAQDKGAPAVTRERMLFSINGTGSIGYSYVKKLFVPLPHTTYKCQFQMDCRSKYESQSNKTFRERLDCIFVILE